MARGRQLTTSRSERLLTGYGYGYSNNGYGDSCDTDASELREEDIWGGVNDGPDNGSYVTQSDGHQRGVQRGAADRRHHVGGLSLAFQGTAARGASPRIVHQYRGTGCDNISAPLATPSRGGGSSGIHQVATSAPVNVPDWSKIYRVNSVESMHESDDGMDGEIGSEIVPPHEYLYARSQKAATSVFEGVGRTLKGRDLRRVRDAVWSQTGFDG